MIIQLTQPGKLRHINGQILKPGANTVTQEWWENAKKHPHIKNMLDEGLIVVMQDEKAHAKDLAKGKTEAELDAGLIAKLKPHEAISMVKETINAELLQVWLKNEKRKNVVSAIEKQLSALEAPAEPLDRSKSRQVTTGNAPEHIEIPEPTPGPDDE